MYLIYITIIALYVIVKIVEQRMRHAASVPSGGDGSGKEKTTGRQRKTADSVMMNTITRYFSRKSREQVPERRQGGEAHRRISETMPRINLPPARPQKSNSNNSSDDTDDMDNVILVNALYSDDVESSWSGAEDIRWHSGRDSGGGSYSDSRSSFSDRSTDSGGRRRQQKTPKTPTVKASPKKSSVRPMHLSLNPLKPVPAIENTRATAKLITERIKRGPGSEDGHGFMYMYRYEHDSDPNYRKIGRTERLPDRRLKEWPDAVLVKSWRCRRNRYAETLIHWLLHKVRVYRYVMGTIKDTKREVLLSIHASSRKFVQDLVYQQYRREGTPMIIKGKSRHIEWFLADEATLMKVIDIVVGDINLHWAADEPWSVEMDAMK